MNTRSYEECHGKLRLESVGGEYSWSTYVDINAPKWCHDAKTFPLQPRLQCWTRRPNQTIKKYIRNVREHHQH